MARMVKFNKLTDYCPYVNVLSCPIWKEALFNLELEPCGIDEECIELLEAEREREGLEDDC